MENWNVSQLTSSPSLYSPLYLPSVIFKYHSIVSSWHIRRKFLYKFTQKTYNFEDIRVLEMLLGGQILSNKYVCTEMKKKCVFIDKTHPSLPPSRFNSCVMSLWCLVYRARVQFGSSRSVQRWNTKTRIPKKYPSSENIRKSFVFSKNWRFSPYECRDDWSVVWFWHRITSIGKTSRDIWSRLTSSSNRGKQSQLESFHPFGVMIITDSNTCVRYSFYVKVYSS